MFSIMNKLLRDLLFVRDTQSFLLILAFIRLHKSMQQ
jgi:hypothetical protein